MCLYVVTSQVACKYVIRVNQKKAKPNQQQNALCAVVISLGLSVPSKLIVGRAPSHKDKVNIRLDCLGKMRLSVVGGFQEQISQASVPESVTG